MTTADIERLAVIVKVNGKVMQVLTKKENTDIYLQMIAEIEGKINILDKPLTAIEFYTEEKDK